MLQRTFSSQAQLFILLVTLRSTVWMKTVYIEGLSWLRSHLYPVFMLRAKINDKPPFLLSASTQARFPAPKSTTSFFLLPFLFTSSPQKVMLSQSRAAHSLTVMNNGWIRLVGRRRRALLSRYLFTPATCSYRLHVCVCVRVRSHTLKPSTSADHSWFSSDQFFARISALREEVRIWLLLIRLHHFAEEWKKWSSSRFKTEEEQ